MTDDLIRRGLDRPLPALTGRLRGEAGTGYRYAFQLDGGRYDIRAGDRVRIHANGRDALGVVHRFDRTLGLLHAVSREWLGERLDGAELEFDPTWLLSELSRRLAEVAEDPEAFFPETVLATFGRRPPQLGREAPRLPSSDDLNAPQRRALERLLGSSAHLVWGPPGTGKSRLAARAALELARRGRVLVAATTNGAVDELARRLGLIADPALLDADRIIRVGVDVGAVPEARLDFGAAVARRIEGGAGGVDRALADLEARLRARPPTRKVVPPSAGDSPSAPIAGAPSASIATATPHARAGRLLALARSRGDAEAARAAGRALLEITRQAERVLEEAHIVLTTFARLSIREELQGLRFQSLLVDEASTALLPYVAVAASRVRGAVVAVGDFQQLPPVVASSAPSAERWLRTDLFREVGVVDETRGDGLPGSRDALCAMLDVQYRMAPAIRELVSDFFYGGRLRDAPEVRERPRRGRALRVLDTSPLDPRVERADGSRRNRLHAEVVVDFLEQAVRDGISDIAVVSPYRAQNATCARPREAASRPGGAGRIAREHDPPLSGAGEAPRRHRHRGRPARTELVPRRPSQPGLPEAAQRRALTGARAPRHRRHGGGVAPDAPPGRAPEPPPRSPGAVRSPCARAPNGPVGAAIGCPRRVPVAHPGVFRSRERSRNRVF